MRLPVYLQVALVLSISVVSSRQDAATPLRHATPGGSFLEEGTDVAVCRQATPDDPGDVDTDTVLVNVRTRVEQLMASVPAEDSSAFLSGLEYEFGEVDHTSDLNYVSMWDSDAGEWVTVCVDRDTYALRSSTMSDPIEVVVVVTFRI